MIFATLVCDGVFTNSRKLGATLTVHLQVDKTQLRSAGGCYTTETSTARICVPSYVGAYAFNSKRLEWTGPAQPDAASISASQITYETTSTSDNWFGAVSALQCCDYNGLASSCGDMICMAEPGGLLAETPVVTPSTSTRHIPPPSPPHPTRYLCRIFLWLAILPGFFADRLHLASKRHNVLPDHFRAHANSTNSLSCAGIHRP